MKNLNELSNLQSVKAPEGLKERTLEAAREMLSEEKTTRPRHLKTGAGKGAILFKRAAAVLCASGIALGGAVFWKSGNPQQPVGDAVAETIMNSFGFVAYAADTGKTVTPKNSKIVFDSDSGCDDPEKGFFSGCLFKVTGGDIKTVSAEIDGQCAIYRAKRFDLPSGDFIRSAEKGEAPSVPGMEGADQVMVSGTKDEDNGEAKWWADTCWVLENGFTDEYDADASYGFWAPPESAQGYEEDLQKAWHGRIDTFEGLTLTVTVTFTDNTSQTQTMKLHTGKLGVEYPDDNSGFYLTGEVYDKPEDYGKPYVYGVYGEII